MWKGSICIQRGVVNEVDVAGGGRFKTEMDHRTSTGTGRNPLRDNLEWIPYKAPPSGTGVHMYIMCVYSMEVAVGERRPRSVAISSSSACNSHVLHCSGGRINCMEWETAGAGCLVQSGINIYRFFSKTFCKTVD